MCGGVLCIAPRAARATSAMLPFVKAGGAVAPGDTGCRTQHSAPARFPADAPTSLIPGVADVGVTKDFVIRWSYIHRSCVKENQNEMMRIPFITHKTCPYRPEFRKKFGFCSLWQIGTWILHFRNWWHAGKRYSGPEYSNAFTLTFQTNISRSYNKEQTDVHPRKK